MKKVTTLLMAALTLGAVATANADTLTDIKSSGKMTVGIDPTFPPYEFTNSSGEIVGYSVEIMKSFASELGVKLEMQKMSFGGILPGLISGSFDAEGSSLNYTPERAKKVAFTVPYSKTVNGVMMRAELAQKLATKTLSVDDLSGLRGAVKSTSVPEKLLKQFNQTLTKAGKKPITIISVDTLDQTVSTLMTKRADFVMDDISVLAPLLSKYPNRLKKVGELGPTQWMGWATRKQDTALNQAISKHILAMQESGELAKLQQQFLGATFTVPADNFISEE
ncbi:polar amino acid transport system substrate-binding protein [Vibrio xiamenensis]|uniref:Polar amino acid transport system substrate-binding protein n=1 Tax=Vibrio xiamenensis TaxID=861298 RepID=A0A1G7W823_9VIBR|nr:transporter substrate-binding domain-containing protein [Vibrio xiamenensis]SDG68073.1 polar amino acid transport system substrate-binding protein [Vibrio xiamenensis]